MKLKYKDNDFNQELLNDLPKINKFFDFNLVNSPRNIKLDKELFVFEFYKDKLEFQILMILKDKTLDDGKTLEIDMGYESKRILIYSTN